MKRLHFAAACVSFICITFILVSCLEELEDTDKIGGMAFEPEIGFPLVNSNFTMEEFLTEGGSKARISEESGIMVLTYDDSVFTPDAETIFTIPDQQSPVISIAGPEVTFPSPGSSVTVSKSITFAFNPTPGDNLDSILIKAGQMLFSITSTFPANINLAISIPSLRQQGAGFQQNSSLTGAGSLSPSTDLQGASLDLTVNGTTTNTVTFAITATITDTGQPINNTHTLDCSFSMSSLGFRGLFGNVDTRSFALNTDSIDVDIFDSGLTGSIEFLSPAVRLDVSNSFGMPVGFEIQNISVIDQDYSTIQLTGPAVNAPVNPYLVNGPSYSQIGESITTQIPLNSGNSNIAQLFSSLPYYLEYGFGAVLDPPGNTQNFVLDSSRVAIGVHLELPFHAKVSVLTVSKEYDFDGLGIDDIGECIVRVKTVNELPLDAAVQVYFLDGNDVVLDSLFANPSIIEGAQVDADGFTPDHVELITEVPVTQEKVDRINLAEHLLVRAEMHSTNQGSVPVKFSVIDKLQVSIGVRAKVKYKLN
jgi:hypothetical protein